MGKDFGAFQGSTWYLRVHSSVRLTGQGALPAGMSFPGDGPSYDEPVESLSHEWQHSIGEILTTLLDAGLRITSFAEHPVTLYKQFPGRT